MTLPPLTSEFVGMVGYTPASFHDLIDKEVESDGSSIGDIMTPSHPLSWECAIADVPGQLPEVVESQQTHTPWTLMRRPWRMRRRTTTSCDSGVRASSHLR